MGLNPDAPQGYCKNCCLRLHIVEHNSEGLCIHCQNYLDRPWDAGKEKFIRLVSGFAGKGTRGYDVMCPLTGGKDSVFVLYCLTQFVPQVRVLALTWDHGFHREQSWRNMRNAVAACGTEHVVLPLGESQEDTYRVIQGFQRELGLPCLCCSLGGQPILLGAAAERGVPLVVLGTIEGQNRRHYSEELFHLGEGELSVAARNCALCSEVICRSFERSKSEKIVDRLLGPFLRAMREPLTLPAELHLGHFFNWNKNETGILRMLEEAFAFQRPDDVIFHGSCELSKIRGYGEYVARPDLLAGSRDKPVHFIMEYEMAAIVRSGALSREEGLREMEKVGIGSRVPDETIQHYIEKVGISRADFDRNAWSKQPSPDFLLAVSKWRSYWHRSSG